jgi:hypothetical protein
MDKLELIVDKIDSLKDDVKDSTDEIKNDISEMRTSMVEIEIDLRKNTDDMRYHIKRTDLTDEIVTLLRAEVADIKTKLTVEYLLKLIMTVVIGIGAISTSVYGVIKLIDYLAK